MMGVSFVSLSSFWGGRLRATRLSFFYISGLAFWFGMKSYWVGPNTTSAVLPTVTPPVVSATPTIVPARVPKSPTKKCDRKDFQYNPKTHTPQPRNTDKPEELICTQ